MRITRKENSMSTQPLKPPADLKHRIEVILSEILSDKHGCKITLRFERKEKK